MKLLILSRIVWRKTEWQVRLQLLIFPHSDSSSIVQTVSGFLGSEDKTGVSVLHYSGGIPETIFILAIGNNPCCEFFLRIQFPPSVTSGEAKNFVCIHPYVGCKIYVKLRRNARSRLRNTTQNALNPLFLFKKYLQFHFGLFIFAKEIKGKVHE